MNPDIPKLFEVLLSYLTTFKNIKIIYLKTYIHQFKIGAAFLSVYTKKNHLELEFQLHREEDQFTRAKEYPKIEFYIALPLVKYLSLISN